MKQVKKEHYQSVNRFLFILLIVFSCLGTLQAFIASMYLGVVTLTITIVGIGVAAYIIFKVDQKDIAAFGVPFICFLGILGFTIMAGGKSYAIIELTMASLMSLLYVELKYSVN